MDERPEDSTLTLVELGLMHLDSEGVLRVVRNADGRLERRHGVMAAAVDGGEAEFDDGAVHLRSGFFGAIFVGWMWLFDLPTSPRKMWDYSGGMEQEQSCWRK